MRFGREMGIPWGLSESAYGETDEGRRYRYRAFGVPSLALHRDSTPRLVVAPYAVGTREPGGILRRRGLRGTRLAPVDPAHRPDRNGASPGNAPGWRPSRAHGRAPGGALSPGGRGTDAGVSVARKGPRRGAREFATRAGAGRRGVSPVGGAHPGLARAGGSVSAREHRPFQRAPERAAHRYRWWRSPVAGLGRIPLATRSDLLGLLSCGCFGRSF